MNKFGVLKTKLLNKLTESYAQENKTEIKSILTLIKENKEFKEMYLFYEEIENKYIEDKDISKLYVEGLSDMLNNKMSSDSLNGLTSFCESLNKRLSDVETQSNELYESLDTLSEKDILSNIEKKVIAKKKLVEHLTTKKNVNKVDNTSLVTNETLLNAVLANNFNVLYSNTLSESQKDELKNILSIPQDELLSKTNELKESIINQVSTLLNESNDNDLVTKLNQVRDEVTQMTTSKYNYYRLTELKNGLN